MITISDVSKRYGTVEALKAINLNVGKGEIYGYLGPNGAGKTTSMKILAGLINVFQGEVSVAGHSLKRARREAQAVLGYVPQDAGFQEWRTVEHALLTFAALSGVDAHTSKTGVDKALGLLRLEEHRKRRILHLSGGNIQKVRIAQALIHDPRVLILDEPLSGLDPASRFDVKNLIRELKAEGKTILLSSHILSDVEDIADRIGVIHEGTLKDEGTLPELRNKYSVGMVLEVETDSSSRTKDVLDNIEGVERVEVKNGESVRLRLENGVDLDGISKRLLSTLLDADIAVRSFARSRPSLEQVYLSLTGGRS